MCLAPNEAQKIIDDYSKKIEEAAAAKEKRSSSAEHSRRLLLSIRKSWWSRRPRPNIFRDSLFPWAWESS
jgi:hypothetical protein